MVGNVVFDEVWSVLGIGCATGVGWWLVVECRCLGRARVVVVGDDVCPIGGIAHGAVAAGGGNVVGGSGDGRILVLVPRIIWLITQ